MKHDFPKISKKKLCELFGKSRGAIYDHQKRVKEAAFNEDIILKYVKELRISKNVRDTRKLHLDLKEPLETHGIRIGRDYLFDLLRSHKLLTRKRKRRVVTTDSRHWMRKYANLIAGLDVVRPEQVWVSDITYINMNGRWGYLSLITDVYSRKIMGYHLRTDLSAQGCIAALQMAISHRQYPHVQLIHHSDRGSQYCSAGYIEVLNNDHIAISMTENGSPYENAIAERVNGTIKGEFNLHESRLNYEGTCELVAKSINIYNEHRRHASCDYLTPQQAHQMQGPLKKRWKNYPRRAPKLQQELRE